jgi:SAM-dependent methyltransferase
MGVQERFRWAVEQLSVGPDDRVLEIGCGAGVAAGMVARRLTAGRITAVDRSAAAVRRAAARNQEYVDDGRAAFVVSALEDLPAGPAYDIVFAVNVSLFWYGPGSSVRAAADLLAPDGTLYVFHQPPLESKVAPMAARTVAQLRAQGFRPAAPLYHPARPAPVSCVAARLSPAPPA